MMDYGHVPVLAGELLELLQPRSGQLVLDCTVGRGGHASLILPHLAPCGRYVGIDADPANVEFVRERFSNAPVQVEWVHANFFKASTVMQQLGVKVADIVLADLGFASTQMADPARGMSFAEEGPLDMRLDPTQQNTAANLVNELSQDELADLIYRYGQDRFSRMIARKIVEQRSKSPIKTTTVLAGLVRQVYGQVAAGRRFASGRQKRRRRSGRRIDPATRTFMALRIAVNGELDALAQLLQQLPDLVATGGIAAMIGFHSLEDRLIKRRFADLARKDLGEVLTRKPITAGQAERAVNPRSRSAKLRAIQIVAPGTNTT